MVQLWFNYGSTTVCSTSHFSSNFSNFSNAQVPGGGGDRGRPWGRPALGPGTPSIRRGDSAVFGQGLAAWVGPRQ